MRRATKHLLGSIVLLTLSFSVGGTAYQAARFASPAVAHPEAILRPVMPLALKIWQMSETDPKPILPYLDITVDKLPKETRARLSPGEESAYTQYMTVQRLGDVGDLEIAAELERRATEFQKRKGAGIADFLNLAAQRIRLRYEGADKYLSTMMEWVQTPNAPQNSDPESTVKVWRRIRDGARALAIAKYKPAVPVLIARYRTPQWNNLHNGFFLIRALAQFEDPQILPVLREALIDFSPGFPFATTVPLEPGEIDVPVAYWRVRTQGMTKEQRVEALITALQNEPLPGTDKVLALEGEDGIKAFMKILQSPPAGEYGQTARRVAATNLGRLRAGVARPLLESVMLDPKENIDVRRSAASALGSLGDPNSVPALIKASQEKERSLIFGVLSALTRIGDPRAEDAVIAHLKHEDHNVRSVAAETLRVIGGVKAVQALQAAIASETNENVRKTMEASIRMIGERRQ